ncbi:MAG: hypothetical protein EAX95_12220 [Candidatus Thorarchaeota archaeon]|nr:hypothetical protein [Candidatus Thorarchaeota archaeon]
MGRTARTFRDAIRVERNRWDGFRRTLKPEDRERLDRVFETALAHGDAGTMIATPRIAEVALFATIMDLLKQNDELQRRIAALEDRLKE